MKPPTLTVSGRILLNLLSAALVVRLLRLDDLSLWADEGVTWWNATHGTWRDALFAEPNHPPAWWLLTRAWVGFFGDSESALRMPAAILGWLSVWLAWCVARRLCDPARVPSRGGFVGLDPRAPLWVAGLAAVNAFWIEYAQEARMYSALLAESLGLTLLYLRWLDGGKRWPLVAYAALAVVALHTHYFAVWPIVSHAAHAWLVARRERSAGGGAPASAPLRLRPLLVAQGVAALSFAPWLAWMLGRFHGISPGAYEPFGRLAHALWRMGTGPALVALDRARVEAGPMAVLRDEAPFVAATAALWVVPIAFGVRALWRDRGLRAFLLASLVLPLLLVLALVVKWPLVHEKYLVFLAPYLLLLAVLGARTAPALLRPLLLGGLVVLHVAGLVAYHAGDVEPVRTALAHGHPYGKEQWREAHAWVARHAGAGDVVLVHAPFLHETWDYYDRNRRAPVRSTPLPPEDVPCDRLLSPDDLLARVPALRTAPRVFLVLSHEATDDRDDWIAVVGQALVGAGRSFSTEQTGTYPRQWGIRVIASPPVREGP